MSEQFTISTVPLPNPCGRPSRYPYRQLAVGGSFFVANVVNLTPGHGPRPPGPLSRCAA